MDLIKRHYEKLILLVLFLTFIGTMIYVLNIIRQTSEVTEESLQIPTREADYEQHDPASPVFDVAGMVKATSLVWAPATPRDKTNSDYFTQLMSPYDIARCAHCGKLIPFFFFSGKKCPVEGCDGELVAPPKSANNSQLGFITAPGEDSDRDGMSDTEETKFGFNSNDASDALLDADGDGFSNVYEVRNGTNPLDPRSHAPYWYRLKLERLDKIKLPVKFMAVNTNKSQNPAEWDLQINDTNTNRTTFYMLNETLTLDKRDYKIVKIDLVQTEIPAAIAGASATIKDESIIYLEQLDGPDKLTMEVGSDVYSSDIKAIFKDTGEREKAIVCAPGEEFTMGNARVGGRRAPAGTKYRVKSIDTKANTALLENPRKLDGDTTQDERGGVMLVTKSGKIPEQMLVNHESRSMEDGMGGPGYPGAMGGY